MSTKDISLKGTERIDNLICNGLKIIQDDNSFCFSIDAVILANYVKCKKGAKVIDLGTGSGVIPLLISAKTNADLIVGIEIQKELSERANRSIRYNGLENKIKVYNMDLINAPKKFDYYFDVVVSNPPYMPVGKGKINLGSAIAISKHEIKCDLKGIAKTASKLLKFKGDFYLVHRTDRMAEIIYELKLNSLEPKELRFIYTKSKTVPTLLLLRCIKGGKPSLKILEPLFVYDENGDYSREMNEIFYP